MITGNEGTGWILPSKLAHKQLRMLEVMLYITTFKSFDLNLKTVLSLDG
jgi:hypothetical protein